MKLAEALIARADIQKRLAQIQARILENARVQEGDSPSEDPAKLILEFDELLERFSTLVAKINKTNLSVTLQSGLNLTESIANRDSLKLKSAMRRAAADAGIGKQARVTRSEVKFVAVVNVGNLREEADLAARQYRELDSKIQEANWNFDLIE